MQNESNLKMTGELTLTLRDEFGNIKQVQHVPNLVVTAGKGFIASRMASAGTGVMSHMAIGTNATAVVAGDTTLGASGTNEVARVELAVSGGTPSGSTVAYSATFPAGTPGTAQAITEAGIFNANSAGTMLCRTVFSVINKGTLDSLTVNWNITIN